MLTKELPITKSQLKQSVTLAVAMIAIVMSYPILYDIIDNFLSYRALEVIAPFYNLIYGLIITGVLMNYLIESNIIRFKSEHKLSTEKPIKSQV